MMYIPIQKEQGFVVLFTVLIASIILVMTVSISSISLKESQLAGSAREAHYSFFAADSGAECALFLDRIQRAFSPSPVGSFSCGGENVVIATAPVTQTFDDDLTMTYNTEYRFVLNLDGGERCADVVVYKNTTTPNKARIESLGYNTACNDVDNILRVERGLRVRY